ncbi:MAG: hypothetical protein IKQ40_00440 [Lachnospiraceae bacterium]|nr:hypothetical protein [Lachnospiraceae bacterium]
MFDTKEYKRISASLLFFICAVLGAICFIGIYGTAILDFTNTGWLFDNDHDLRQHYIGWCAFRNTPWRFPIGLTDRLSYPNSMSVIYTDSIPLFAIIFKLMGAYLPVTFQYFGLFGILSFALMGGFSSLLLRRIVASDVCCVTGSLFYVMSAPVIQRMYYHTALGAQWIIIAAMAVWIYGELISDKRLCVYWGIIGAVCVWIHSYFLPMTGMILAALMLTQFVRKKRIALILGEFASFCATGLLSLYVLGAFYGGTSAAGEGIGTFTCNLNTFINPWEIGSFLPQMPLQNYFQYEGMAYLGAGILLLFVIIAAGMLFRSIRHVPEAAFHSDKVYGQATVLLFFVSFFSALLPNISFNEINIVWIPYPGFVESILGIFRSNGRFIWTAMYILMTAAISFTAYTFRRYRPVAAVVLAGALMLQVADMWEAFHARHELYTSFHPIGTIWDEGELSGFAEGQREFIFMYTDNDITMPTAYYAYLHGMRQNNYYFARDIDDKTNEVLDLYKAEIENGNIREGAVYVLKREDYENDKEIYDRLNAEMVKTSDHVMFKAKK